jgi:large subunit ribosomal protein L15
MKLHDLKPAPGSHKKKTRVGRGIAAGKGKTAGRGTKGQKARAGGKIPAWFEGGQTPLHQRIPKLRGFKNPFKIEYEVVNVGAIASLVELGVLESGEMPGAKKAKAAAPAPITVNQEILRAAGLVRSLDKPMKILGNGELSTALFVVTDRISASARAKIEAAGGSVSLLEVPTRPTAALGVTADGEPEEEPVPAPRPKARKGGPAPEAEAEADSPPEAPAAPGPPTAPEAAAEPKAAARSRTRAKAAPAAESESAAEPTPAAEPEPDATATAPGTDADDPSADA